MLWLFVPFVVIVSGVVAYAADTIARKVGRKHMRWFGLRPKTTALLVAVLAGMGISAASLGAFVLLNKNAIDTIAAADQLRPQLDALRQEIKGVQGDLKAANEERDAAQQEASRLSDLQVQAQRDLESTRADLKAAHTAETKLLTESRGLQSRVQALTGTIRTLELRAQENRTKLQQSEQALSGSQARAQQLDAQVVELNTHIALSAQETRTAQDRAQAAQQLSEQAQARAQLAQAQARQVQAQADQVQVQARQAQAQARQNQLRAAALAVAAQAQVTALKGQVTALEASRQQAAQALADAQAAKARAQAQQQAAQQARDRLALERDTLTAERNRILADRDRMAADRDRIAAERDKAAADRNRLAAERDRVARDRDRVRDDLGALQQQQVQLKNSNDALARDLAATRASLGRLQDEYSSSRAELSASRNTDLAYPKNDLVYAAVVPGVRNLDKFLQDAAGAAQGRGARGTPSVRLSAPARAALETKLRGLNVTTFVQCRAAQNAAVGFPVDLTCDARPNSVLYREGEVIRRVSVNLKGDPQGIQQQISDLIKDTVVDITARGVPDEYILNQGLDVTEFVNLITRLSGSASSSAVVGLAARSDVKPSTRVDLYPVLPAGQ